MRAVRRSFSAAVLLCAAAYAAFASGAWPLPFFTSGPKAVLSAAAQIHPPGAKDLVLLDSDCAMKINEQGRALVTCRFLFRPISQAGVEMIGTFQAPWVEWREAAPALRIRVISPDGSARELDPSKVTEGSGDSKVMEARLPPAVIDSVVEIETVSQDREAIAPGSRFAFFQPDNLATGHWRASVEAPAAMPLRVKAERLAGAKRTESQTGPTHKVTIEFSDAPVRKEWSALPPESSAPPRVAISAGVGWEALAMWYGPVLERQIGEMASSAGVADAVRGGIIASAVAAIESSVALEKQALGPASFLPASTREVVGRRRGNSLELSVALAARLRAAGIQAYIALLTPYPGPDAEPDMPGLETFTHAVVYLPGRQPLWIDAADPSTPPPRLPLADQGRLALVVRPGMNGLTRTPASEAAENRFTEYQNITLAKSGLGEIDEIEEGEGYFGDVFRATGRALKAVTPEQREPYEKSLAAAYGFEKTVQTDVVNLNDPGKPVRLVFSGIGYKFAVTNDAAAIASIAPVAPHGAVAGGVLNALLAAVNEAAANPDVARTADYYVMPRCIVERRVHIAPPPGYKLLGLPALPPAAIGPLPLLRQATVADNGAVDIVYHLEIPRNSFTPAEGNAIASDMQRLEALPMIRLEFAPSSLAKLISTREYAAAAALLEADSADAALLRGTRRNQDLRNSDDPLLAVAQETVRGLLDGQEQRPWRIYYADSVSPSASLASERARLLDALAGFRSVGGVAMDLQGVADLALSNLKLSYEGSDTAGYRVRFPDPKSGAMKTLGRFVKTDSGFRVIGMGDGPDPIR